jgi:hypothetical protein
MRLHSDVRNQGSVESRQRRGSGNRAHRLEGCRCIAVIIFQPEIRLAEVTAVSGYSLSQLGVGFQPDDFLENVSAIES